MIKRNLKVGDKFRYVSPSLMFDAICTFSENGHYTETIINQGNSGWQVGSGGISSTSSENKYITLIEQEPLKLENYRILAKNGKHISSTIRKMGE